MKEAFGILGAFSTFSFRSPAVGVVLNIAKVLSHRFQMANSYFDNKLMFIAQTLDFPISTSQVRHQEVLLKEFMF